ncbi:hypothetical protein LC612_43015, partial [Nostoc sp. CHAB 5834]|nr:hypothetical protein [Nostoc sp. CHAB 5834]
YPKEGYQQTPLVWQAGKFFIVAGLLSIIYMRSRFVNRVPVSLLFLYGFLGIVLITNIGSALLYGQLLTDEIEYLIFAACVLPIGFLNREGLNTIESTIHPALNMMQYVLIVSNWIVIFNYFAFRIIPFHAYEGILLRFGGLWDDPNAVAIISVFFVGYALLRKQYILVAIHAIHVLLTISLNGYLLLFALVAYFFLNTDKNKALKIMLFGSFICLLVLLAVSNLDFILRIYEAKQESIEQHATIDLDFKMLPLFQPVQFHETWLLSLNINYFPFSVPVTIAVLVLFVRFFLFSPRSLQRLFFILFFVTNLFLPFLYMFPVNFIALLFLVLYTKGVRF